MNTMEHMVKVVEDVLKGLSESEQLRIFNDNGMQYGEHIYTDVNTCFAGCQADYIIRMVQREDIDVADKYFYEYCDGEVRSFKTLGEAIGYRELAKDIVRNMDFYNCSAIQVALANALNEEMYELEKEGY